MEIKSLHLFSNHIDEQEYFYRSVLGFNTVRIKESQLKVEAGSTTIYFDKTEKKYFYHFAFLIPTGTLQSSMSFLELRNISLLLYEGKNIVYFDQGTAIYFFDSDGNIVEFIERPNLGHTSEKDFSIEDILKVNEIGLTVSEPFLMKDQLINEFGVKPGGKAIMRSDFCWLGDHNGAIIVSKEGRHWLPTQIAGTFNDFRINYTDRDVDYDLSFVRNKIISN